MAYHMRRDEKEIKDWTVIEEIIRHGKFTTLALCRNNEPYGVTLSYGYDRATRSLYFHCAPEGLKTEFVQQNAAACATIIDDRGYIQGECKHLFRSVVIRGKVEILTREADKKVGFKTLLEHLEDDPAAQASQMPTKAEDFAKVTIWKLTIAEYSAKES